MTTTISSKGQIVIPAEIRRRHGLHAGDELVVEDTPVAITIRKKDRNKGLVEHLMKFGKMGGFKIPKMRKGYLRPPKF